MMRQVGFGLFFSAFLGLLTGCGGGDIGTQKVENPGKIALEDIGQMLKGIAEERRKPPAKLAEFEPFEPMAPVGAPAIRNGEIVYLWGSAFSATGERMVAYEKKVPSDGGFVLLENGQVKSISATEFGSMPKAK
jgi:hypothetical protein